MLHPRADGEGVGEVVGEDSGGDHHPVPLELVHHIPVGPLAGAPAAHVHFARSAAVHTDARRGGPVIRVKACGPGVLGPGGGEQVHRVGAGPWKE